MPKACPSCGTPLIRREGEVDYRCPNKAGCPSQGQEWLFHFAGRGAMDIEGLGYKTLWALVEKGLVQDPADIYTLTAEQLEQQDRFAEKSITNLLTQIEGSKDRPLWRLLVGLNIRHVGTHVAQVLATAFGSIDALIAATVDDIDDVEGIGPEIAASVREWFEDPENLALLERLRAAGLRTADERAVAAPNEGPLTGTTVVLTGTMPSMTRSPLSRNVRVRSRCPTSVAIGTSAGACSTRRTGAACASTTRCSTSRWTICRSAASARPGWADITAARASSRSRTRKPCSSGRDSTPAASSIHRTEGACNAGF